MTQGKSPAVRFLHVPKTAGTSVNGILETIYATSETFDFSGDVPCDLALLRSFPPDRFDLDDFLGSGCEELSNFQSRMLLGSGGYASIDPSHDDREKLEDCLRKSINGLRFVGIQEKFRESVLLLGRSFGWRIVLPRKRLNQAGPSRELRFSDRQMERIRQLNELDAHVYRHASEVLSGLIKRNRGTLLLDRYRSFVRSSRQRVTWEIKARLHKAQIAL